MKQTGQRSRPDMLGIGFSRLSCSQLGFGRLDVIIVLLLLALVALQYPLWMGPNGWREVERLESAVDDLDRTLEVLDQRNRALSAEINDLRDGLDAVEERARRDLGLIRDGELYLFFVEPGTDERR
ncbi:MAG: septum formation initiator family protein [Thioalkalivibrionaceae bacterium]